MYKARACSTPYSARNVARDIINAGYGDFLFKSDGEPAIVALKKAAVGEVRRLGHSVIAKPEESPVGDSKKNGYIERAIWEVQSMVRTLVHQANEMHGTNFNVDHAVIVWAVRYAGQVISRFQRSLDDGKTTYERRRGNPYRRKLPCFGELVMFMPVEDKSRRKKLEEHFRTGMYVGLVDRSDEVVVLTSDGFFRVNVIRRLPVEQRGDKDFALACRGYPWDGQGQRGADPDVAEAIVPFLAHDPDLQLPPPVEPARLVNAPKRVYIRKEVELRRYGFTQGCAGCVAVQNGLRAQSHSEGEEHGGR